MSDEKLRDDIRMTLLERLRAASVGLRAAAAPEAANEIERLRAALEHMINAANALLNSGIEREDTERADAFFELLDQAATEATRRMGT